jgi:hypothetical protein
MCDGVGWIEPNQDLFQWWGLQYMVINIRVLKKEGNFLTK